MSEIPSSASLSNASSSSRVEREALGRALHLDESAAPVITTFMSVSARTSSEYSRSSIGVPSMMPTEMAAHGFRIGCVGERARLHEARARVVQRDPAAADRRGARAAVGLQHVAVDRDLHVGHLLQVGDGAQRAADETLDLLRAARLLAFRRLAADALGRRARQHRVLGGDPSLARALEPRRDALLDRRGAQHARAAELDEHRTVRHLRVVAREQDRAEIVGVRPDARVVTGPVTRSEWVNQMWVTRCGAAR